MDAFKYASRAEGEEGGGKEVEAEWDGVQHVHNGYVRQGWILLINPTGYIVPPARDGHTASSVPCFVPEDAPLRWSSAARSVPRPSILRFYEKAVSFYRDELCRRPVRVVIISLSLCALAPKAVPVCGYRAAFPPHVPFPPSGRER